MPVLPVAAVGAPAPVVVQADPASGHKVQPQGHLRIPAHVGWCPLGVAAEVQVLLQVPVVVTYCPQLNWRREGEGVRQGSKKAMPRLASSLILQCILNVPPDQFNTLEHLLGKKATN